MSPYVHFRNIRRPDGSVVKHTSFPAALVPLHHDVPIKMCPYRPLPVVWLHGWRVRGACTASLLPPPRTPVTFRVELLVSEARTTSRTPTTAHVGCVGTVVSDVGCATVRDAIQLGFGMLA